LVGRVDEEMLGFGVGGGNYGDTWRATEIPQAIKFILVRVSYEQFSDQIDFEPAAGLIEWLQTMAMMGCFWLSSSTSAAPGLFFS